MLPAEKPSPDGAQTAASTDARRSRTRRPGQPAGSPGSVRLANGSPPADASLTRVRPRPKRKPTSTSAFGAGKRESHDASGFYERGLAVVPEFENTKVNEPLIVDEIFEASATKMTEIADDSVALMVTSPPYHVGKALRSSTPVLGPAGWTKIGDLVPGDVVFAADGTPTNVEAVFPQGPRQLYRITLDDGTWIDADAEHLWVCQTFTERDKRNRRTDRWILMTTGDMLERWGSRPIAPYRVLLPATAPVQFPEHTVPLAPYALGAILGDGCILPGGYVRICTADPQILEEAGFANANPLARHSYSVNGLAPIMRELGLDHRRAWEKFVPESYLWNAPDVRLGVLQGLLDTDGYVGDNGHVQYVTTSPQLADDVEFLVRSLGGKTYRSSPKRKTFRYKGELRTGRISYSVSIVVAVCPFRLERKAAVWRAAAARRVHTRERVIHSIEPADLDDATCIRVADESGLFVTKDFIVTHNTYDTDSSFDDYLGLLNDVFTETYRVLEPGGRAVVNVANLGRRPYIPLNAHVARIMDEIGFLMRGEVIWRKAEAASGSCAWGSWMSASNPTFRDVHEYCLCFSKGNFKRVRKGENSIDRDEFLAATLSIWDIPPESAKRVGHPAPFPVALPQRFIELYTYVDDLVLDPFMGSGSTALAAVRTGRHYLGYDTDPEYVKLAKARIAAESAPE